MQVLSRPFAYARTQCRLRSRPRPVLRRFAQALPLNRAAPVPAPPEPKTYDAILREMQARAGQWDEKAERIDTNFLNRPCAVDELYKPLDIGDLVLLNLDPVVVLGTPDVPDGPYIVADAVGRAKEVFRNMIDARLMSFVNAERIRALRGELYTLDSAATDAALELGVEPSVTSSAPTSRVVSQPVHRLVARPLRKLYNDAMKRAQKLLPKVGAALKRRQQGQAATATLSFVDLVLEVCPSAASQYTIADFYAIRLCLDHYTLVHKCLLDFSYTGKYALTVLPAAAERRNLEVVYGNRSSAENSAAFVRDYARENIPSAEAESRAIEILRRQFPTADRVDSDVAAELLQLPAGDLQQKLRYSWFKEHARSGFDMALTADSNKLLRQDFEAPVYCIDSADALEIDDGISLERLGTGDVFRLGIHIANPSAFTKTAPLVNQMLKLPTTVYELNGNSVPMLPRELTRHLGLVGDGEPRPALTLFVDVNLRTMALSNVKLTPLMLSQVVNITPETVGGEARDKFAEYSAVASALRSQRLANGAFDLQSTAAPGFATQIVTEFMLLANHVVAEYCLKHKIPLLYRGQRMLTQSEQLGEQYRTTLRKNHGRLGFKWRPIVQKSVVSITSEPHTGIGYSATTRFTSPLRRLEDYIAHCQIEAHLRGEAPPFTENDLARMVPWLQVSQELVREYQRQLVLYDSLTRLTPGSVLDGVVSQVPWDTSVASPHAKTRVYLPALELEADYIGSAQLGIEEACRVVIDSVNTHAGRACVLLVGEKRS